MKVLIDGRKENKPAQIQCHKCSSLLEVTPSDILRKHYDQRDGNCYEFRCPLCSNGIFVNMNRIDWRGV